MISSKKKQTVETVKHYIHTHWRDPISSVDLTQVTFYSRNYCERVFKEVTGQSITDYIQKCKYDKARELLETTEFKCYEIVYMLGYESPTIFMCRFKARFGITMRRYRIQCKESLQWTSQAQSILQSTN